MPYIGTQPLTGQFKKLDAISVVNGQAAYTLNYNSAAYKPATANALLVSVNGVIQAAGDAFNISGSTITFTENLVTGDVIDFIIALGDTGSAVTPVDGSVTTAKLGDDSVTTAKLGDDSVTKAKIGTTELDLATIKDSTGTNTAITIDSNGRLSQGSPVGFNAKITGSGQSITANNTLLKPWGITTSQLYGGFNTDGAGGTMLNQTTGIAQVPVTGYYQINCVARVDSFAGSYHYLDIIKTDSSGTYSSAAATLLLRTFESATASDYTGLFGSVLAYLQANDYVAMYWANSGDNSVTVNNDTFFSMFKVG